MRFKKHMMMLGLGYALLSPATGADSRIWTSRKGSTLEAEFLKCDAVSTTLVTKDSKQIVLKIEDLSLGDRQFLVEYSGADPKILVGGEIGEPEKQVRIESSTIKKLKDAPFMLADESVPLFELTESEHFLIASAGDVRADAVAETAERLWHGMAFQHMNFRRDWADQRMLVFLAENRDAYAALGQWYFQTLIDQKAEEAAAKAKATWDKLGSTSIVLPEEMTKTYNLHSQAVLYNVHEARNFKKAMSPFQIHTIAGALLTKQLGGVSSFGSEGYFAVTTGHSYFKEISLGGKSETQILSVLASDNSDITEKKGFEDGSSWVRGLKAAVRKGTIKVSLEPMLQWKLDGLKPEELVLIYSFSYYMQSSPQRLSAFATMVRRIESSNQIPPAIEIAKIFGFETVEAFNADWALFINEGKFK
jgi:hypothetical protein